MNAWILLVSDLFHKKSLSYPAKKGWRVLTAHAKLGAAHTSAVNSEGGGGGLYVFESNKLAEHPSDPWKL